MGEDGARGKDWLRAQGHHLYLTDNFLGHNLDPPNARLVNVKRDLH